MLKFEWKKILYYRRGLWLLLAVLTAEIAGLLFFTRPYDPVLEENREVYDSYLKQVEGPLTEEKRIFIEGKMEMLSENRKTLTTLETDFYNGTISEDEFKPEFQRLSAIDSDYAGFSKLYSQYIFVREDPHRNFLYTGGWEILLGTQKPVYLFLLLIVFLTAPIFCQEYSSQMDMILLTQKKSSRDSWKFKAAAIFLLTGAMVVFLEGSRLLYCAVRFGLPDWNYSLQSVYSFADTAKRMPLWEAWLLQLFLKELGYISCAGWVLFFAVLLRKYSMVLMAGIVFLILPFLTVNSNTVFLRIPAPWALTIGSIYLNTPSFYCGPRALYNRLPTEFQELNWCELGVQVLLVIGVLFGLLWYVRRKSTNEHFCSRRQRIAMLALCLLMIPLMGCSAKTESPVIYNSYLASTFENENFLIMRQLNTGRYQLIDKATGEHYPFPLDIQDNDMMGNLSFFERNGKLTYFLPHKKQLIELNLETMDQRIIRSWEQPYRWFFGLLPMPESNAFSVPETFFLHGNAIYGDSGGVMFRKNLLSGREASMKHIGTAPNYAYDGKNIYYTDQYSRLVMENLDTGEKITQETVVAGFFLLAPEGIYFLNRQQNNILCLWNGKSVLPLDDTTNGYRIYRDEDYLWLMTQDARLLRMNHDGSDRQEVPFPGFISHFGCGDSFYVDVYAEEEGQRFRIDKKTLEAVEP